MQQLAPLFTPDDSQCVMVFWGNQPSSSSTLFTI